MYVLVTEKLARSVIFFDLLRSLNGFNFSRKINQRSYCYVIILKEINRSRLVGEKSKSESEREGGGGEGKGRERERGGAS